MKVRCIETGRVYTVFHVQQPEKEHIGYREAPRGSNYVPLRDRRVYPVYRQLPGWYFIEDQHGNLAGQLAFEDAEVVEN